MTYHEIFDGFKAGDGFSWEDVVADTTGAALSVVRQTVPGLSNKLDFRVEYIPSKNPGFHPIIDYSGQRYIFALKLSGFESLDHSPLRFVELHAGYYARGFSPDERAHNVPKRRVPFIGLGLNVSKLLFGQPGSSHGRAERLARSLLEFVLIRYTSVHTR